MATAETGRPTPQSTAAGGTGLTTEALTGDRDRASLESFDFETAWNATDGYPVLAGQTVADDESEARAGTATIDGGTVCDLDGDGGFRDVNGDGSVTNGDATTCFANQHTSAWSDRPGQSDFDGSGDVGQSDVIALFEYVAA